MVIGIIALLAAILFPVIVSSKRQANLVKCASNLKQLGIAFQMYLDDWNRVYPSPGGKLGDYNAWNQSGNGGLVRYVRSKGGVGSVWCCPDLHRWDGRYAARTYSMNSYIRGGGFHDKSYNITLRNLSGSWHLFGCPEGLIEIPKKTILLYEGATPDSFYSYPGDYIYRCGDWTCVRGWSKHEHMPNAEFPWHDRRNNYLYCDGHVAPSAPTRYQGRELPAYADRYPWYVSKYNARMANPTY